MYINPIQKDYYMPFGEEVTHGWQWLTGSWGGGMLCGVIATLGLFLVKVVA